MSCLGMKMSMLLALAVALLPQTGLTAGRMQSVTASHRASGTHATAFPALWVSETTHAVYRVRITGGVLRAEQANTPPEAAKQGAYVRTEACKTGAKWVGMSHVYAKITTDRGSRTQQSNWCHLAAHIEFLTLTPERITGRSEAPEQMDIAKCRILKKVWKDFIWVPAK